MTAEQREERRQRVIAAARGLFEEHGYSGFTVERLARECGMSIGAVYLYVPNLLAIFAELLRQDLDTVGDDPTAAVAVLKRYVPAELAEVVTEVGL